MKENLKDFFMVLGIFALVYLVYRCMSAPKRVIAKIRGPVGFACLPAEPIC